MVGCPDGDCKEQLKYLCDYVYGNKGPGTGLMGRIQQQDKELTEKIKQVSDCCKKKMPSIYLWYFLAAFGLSIMTGGYNLFFKAEAGDLKYETKAHAVEMHDELKKMCQENALRSSLNSDRYVQIKEDLAEIKGMIKTVFKKIDDNNR